MGLILACINIIAHYFILECDKLVSAKLVINEAKRNIKYYLVWNRVALSTPGLHQYLMSTEASIGWNKEEMKQNLA